MTQAGLSHLVKSFEIGILSQKRIEVHFQLCFPKPVARIQQIFLSTPYIGTLKQLPGQTVIVFELFQKGSLDKLISAQIAHIPSQ